MILSSVMQSTIMRFRADVTIMAFMAAATVMLFVTPLINPEGRFSGFPIPCCLRYKSNKNYVPNYL